MQSNRISRAGARTHLRIVTDARPPDDGVPHDAVWHPVIEGFYEALSRVAPTDPSRRTLLACLGYATECAEAVEMGR